MIFLLLLFWSVFCLLLAHIIYRKVVINRFFKLILLSWIYTTGILFIYWL